MFYISTKEKLLFPQPFSTEEAAYLYLEDLSVPFFCDVFLVDEQHQPIKVARWHFGTPSKNGDIMYGFEEGYYTAWEDTRRVAGEPSFRTKNGEVLQELLYFVNEEDTSVGIYAYDFSATSIQRALQDFFDEETPPYEVHPFNTDGIIPLSSPECAPIILFNLFGMVRGCFFEDAISFLSKMLPRHETAIRSQTPSQNGQMFRHFHEQATTLSPEMRAEYGDEYLTLSEFFFNFEALRTKLT